MQHAIAEARERDVQQVRVDCWAGAATLIRWYCDHGFEPTGTFEVDGWPGLASVRRTSVTNTIKAPMLIPIPSHRVDPMSLSGVATAARNGLGYALLPYGGDGLRAVSRGPLTETLRAPLWLLVAPAYGELAAPMRSAMPEPQAQRRLTAVA